MVFISKSLLNLSKVNDKSMTNKRQLKIEAMVKNFSKNGVHTQNSKILFFALTSATMDSPVALPMLSPGSHADTCDRGEEGCGLATGL